MDPRDHEAFRALLDKCLQKECAAWAKRLPDAVYRQIFGLAGWPWNAMSVTPLDPAGRQTTGILQERTAPGFLDELLQMNPTRDDGGGAPKLHRHITVDVRRRALAQYWRAVIGLMRTSKAWEQFKSMPDGAFPKKARSFNVCWAIAVCKGHAASRLAKDFYPKDQARAASTK